MADEKPASESGDKAAEPVAEELKPQGAEETPAEGQASQTPIVTAAAKRRHAAYRPSHFATFLGLGVVAFILVANGVALAFLLKNQDSTKAPDTSSVTLSSSTLDKLGVSRDSADDQGVSLKINPATSFGNNVTVADNLSVGGQLNLNGKFTAAEASFNKLQGGDTAVDTLNVNGDATASDLSLRKDLTVVGTTTLQGQVRVSQLMTINNNLNVAGSLSVGGALSVQQLQVGNFQTTGNLTFGGHFITSGTAPSVTKGGAVGSSGTASGNGNDSAGTINVGVGVGASAGILATVTFTGKFGATPHVVVGVIGGSVPGMYITRSTSGFVIYSPTALSPGGYSFDYIAMQ